MPNGFGERGVALDFLACSVFVAVVEYHSWRGQQKFSSVGGLSNVDLFGVVVDVVADVV